MGARPPRVVFDGQDTLQLLDGNGIELYWDRPREEWPLRPDGSPAMVTEPLDLPGLLTAAESG